MSYINGEGTIVGPAKAPVMTKEQEEGAAKKLAAARAARKAKQDAGPDTQSSVTQEPTTPEAQNRPESDLTPDLAPDDIEATLAELAIDQSPAEAVAKPDGDRQPTSRQRFEGEHARWVAEETERLRARGTELGLSFPEGTSYKTMRLKIADAEGEARAGEDALTGALAYQNDLPEEGAFEAAKAAYDEAQHKLNTLKAELAGMPGRIDDAIEASDFDQLQAHRQRATALPFAIEVASMDALKLRLAYQQMKAARSRVAMKEARMLATEATEELKRLQAKQYETFNAAEMARSDHDENVIAVGHTQRELAQLLDDMRGRR